MKTFSSFKKRVLKEPLVKEAYQSLELEFVLAKLIIEKCLKKGLSQKELAEKMGTKQSAISRLESGTYNPSIQFLERLAKALKLRLDISLE
jgi:ribosome-binding protein aMBF1 (putative translation factor)